MLNNTLIEIINSGQAWAFVGSGPSIDSGLPTWSELVSRVAEKLRSGGVTLPSEAELGELEYPDAFGVIEREAGRGKLELCVRESLALGVPGKIVQELTDLPFAGYVTTNYDELLEKRLAAVGERGWTAIGNTDDECRKLAGSVDKVVWHVHGVINSGVPSALVITERDYDRVYLEGSVLRDQLQALLLSKRFLFVGFGFSDRELLRLLKKVRNIANPARPAYAFLGQSETVGKTEDRLERVFAENIRTIHYPLNGDDHSKLRLLLEVYGSFAVRRSLRFGIRGSGSPSYDPDTTSLLIYNRLVLQGDSRRVTSEEALHILLKGRILSLACLRGEVDRRALVDELETRARQILGTAMHADALTPVERALTQLIEGGLLEFKDGGTDTIVPTRSGAEFVASSAASAELRRQQFQQSLRDRVAAAVADDASRERITAALVAFLEETIRRRGLGVAMAWARADLRDYHVVALLQNLPAFMSQLKDEEEASHLSRVTRAFFAEPTMEEKTFLGLALQSQFGLHLLGYHADSTAIRSQIVAHTLYLVDSNVLIPYLARGCIGHPQAGLLVDRLTRLGGTVATTDLLVQEVAEHAQWATTRAFPSGITAESLAVLKGETGGRINAFLEGFVDTVAKGNSDSFFGYLTQALDVRINDPKAVASAVLAKLFSSGIAVNAFEQWDGFEPPDVSERDQLSGDIEFKRKARDTFKHTRQVLAEAEVLVVVRRVRSGIYKLEGRECDDSYFVSHTRVIDEVDGSGRRITIRPESLLLLLGTLVPGPEEELSLLADNLLAELSVHGLRIVDESKLHLVFGGLIDASRQSIASELIKHRELLAERFGESGVRAFSEVADLEAPLVEASLQRQLIRELSERLAESEEARRREAARSKLSDREKAELARLKAEKKQREAAGRKKNRKAAGKGSRRRKRRKKR